LTLEWTPDIEIKVIVVQELVNDWAQHVCENVLADQKDGVSNHYECELNDLEEAKGGEEILMVDV
jgi:hypothetical protein